MDAWVQEIGQQTMLSGGDAVRAKAGPGPIITDDHPRPEYWLLRQLFGDGVP